MKYTAEAILYTGLFWMNDSFGPTVANITQGPAGQNRRIGSILRPSGRFRLNSEPGEYCRRVRSALRTARRRPSTHYRARKADSRQEAAAATATAAAAARSLEEQPQFRPTALPREQPRRRHRLAARRQGRKRLRDRPEIPPEAALRARRPFEPTNSTTAALRPPERFATASQKNWRLSAGAGLRCPSIRTNTLPAPAAG